MQKDASDTEATNKGESVDAQVNTSVHFWTKRSSMGESHRVL